jgi:hypothetical protein
MDFLEEVALYNKAMENAYEIITKRKNIDDIYDSLEAEDIEEYPLPFDPVEEDGRTPDVIDIVIEYFISMEEYEKCSELVNIKKQCQDSETQTE